MFLHFDLQLWKATLASLGLAVLFVVSLYIWPQKYHRNHPTCVNQRFCTDDLFLMSARNAPVTRESQPTDCK
ncbi:hypothetical protein ACHWQZ_G016802 [Mnemiopsis leidyi]